MENEFDLCIGIWRFKFNGRCRKSYEQQSDDSDDGGAYHQ